MRASGLTCSSPGALGSQCKPIARLIATSIKNSRQRHVVRAGKLSALMAVITGSALERALPT